MGSTPHAKFKGATSSWWSRQIASLTRESFFFVIGLLPKLQSAFHAYNSITETAVLKVVGDILHALDTGNIAILTLLIRSAAFDSVNHGVLLQQLQKSYGLQGTVIGWFASYLSGRSQYVIIIIIIIIMYFIKLCQNAESIQYLKVCEDER